MKRWPRCRSTASAVGDAYLDEQEISRELPEASRLMDRRGWRSLDKPIAWTNQ